MYGILQSVLIYFFPFHVYVKNNTTNDDQIKELKKENHDLQQEIKKKDKEIAHLHGIIDNLKGIVFFPNFVAHDIAQICIFSIE